MQANIVHFKLFMTSDYLKHAINYCNDLCVFLKISKAFHFIDVCECEGQVHFKEKGECVSSWVVDVTPLWSEFFQRYEPSDSLEWTGAVRLSTTACFQLATQKLDTNPSDLLVQRESQDIAENRTKVFWLPGLDMALIIQEIFLYVSLIMLFSCPHCPHTSSYLILCCLYKW